MFDLAYYPRFCLKINRHNRLLRFIFLLRRQPLLRLVVFVKCSWPFIRICCWRDLRSVLPNLQAYLKKEIEYAKDEKSKFFTALDWHKGEPGYETPDSEAVCHFVYGSNGAKEFARRYTYLLPSPRHRFVKYCWQKAHRIDKIIKGALPSFFVCSKRNIEASAK